ncbi:bifunctional phosphoribosylaminoimidazolecarboxamide formyltransferase/IMP cyclohydrolase [Natronoflexus pectinivorans]|uniref:Bifunctional purine biosynthesis protein PurH n=1 Tax=Natronoflexus pectinivorans TaxID=682526 RepID=A0A4R2GN69_9BACT|nr:bifunctional phosphoribosylaminoimidazolecarboxamide formyltransferase/IMP cyclohydrolase [Natronoflexus pectinivorans]TCO10742.1 phosphoribosylaminoimidazolecarboxamide formyltransferase/IMP cyclohydrolase [Natronoflexus pectinivorans]
MSATKKIKTALISVFYKDGLDEIVKTLDKQGVKIYSTGGTQSFIEHLGIKVNSVESLTGYPSILGGRVKTLHPKVFGGILAKRDDAEHQSQMKEFEIPDLDLVIVDLYPFEETVASGADHASIIEKIDIGGISLIRAAAKNYKDVVIVPSVNQYPKLLELLKEKKGETSLDDRKHFAASAFAVSSGYDSAIYNYFGGNDFPAYRESVDESMPLRYGENPHQKGVFYGEFNEMFEQLHGKEISYNNLLDIDAAVSLIAEFEKTTVAILKHNNACGLASRDSLTQAWLDALAGDPVSAFGGIIVTNKNVDADAALEMDKIFLEVVIAPSYDAAALDILKQKKNRIILIQKKEFLPPKNSRTLLNGVLVQERDAKTETPGDLKTVTNVAPNQQEVDDLLFANKIVKHSKSNAIVLAKNGQLLASGVGQTSRVDALKHAINKAQSFKFDLNGAVMASDAFFPFADSIEIAHEAGIKSVIQPGGSIRDNETIDFCNNNKVSMVFTGIRHFKH